MKKSLLVILILCLICVSVPAFAKVDKNEIITSQTQLQKRQYQTRQYDNISKAVLMKAMLNVLQDEGFIVKGVNTSIAYYQQNPVFKDLNMTVLEYIKEASDVMEMNDGTVLSASLFLEQFGFSGKIQYSAWIY